MSRRIRPVLKHKILKWIWFCQMIGVVVVYKFLPDIWEEIAVLYLIEVSLYANFATEAGAEMASTVAEKQDKDADVQDVLDVLEEK